MTVFYDRPVSPPPSPYAAITMYRNFLPEAVTKFAKSGLIELLHGEDVGIRTVVGLDLNHKKIISQ